MNIKKSISKTLTVLMVAFLFISCSKIEYAESETIIVDAKVGMEKLDSGYIAVDAQKASSYAKEHLDGAVNIERSSINISDPVPNSVATGDIVSAAASRAGLTSESNIIIYDDNKNMDSSRLFWTLKNYGHKGDILVVSGGLNALKKAGASVNADMVKVNVGNYSVATFNKDSLAKKELLSAMIDNPADDFRLIDVRSLDEYGAGTIPGAIHLNHEDNLSDDLTYKSVSEIRKIYKKLDILPNDTIAMFCKSSIRAANTYVALYNAGYRNIKVYDGAWLEWSTTNMPVFKPEVKKAVTTTPQDNS